MCYRNTKEQMTKFNLNLRGDVDSDRHKNGLWSAGRVLLKKKEVE
jgi:hypothetical protein